MRTKPPTGRAQIGIKLDMGLWWKFKLQAMKEGLTATELLEEVMKEYLRKKGAMK